MYFPHLSGERVGLFIFSLVFEIFVRIFHRRKEESSRFQIMWGKADRTPSSSLHWRWFARGAVRWVQTPNEEQEVCCFCIDESPQWVLVSCPTRWQRNVLQQWAKYSRKHQMMRNKRFVCCYHDNDDDDWWAFSSFRCSPPQSSWSPQIARDYKVATSHTFEKWVSRWWLSLIILHLFITPTTTISKIERENSLHLSKLSPLLLARTPTLTGGASINTVPSTNNNLAAWKSLGEQQQA